MSYSKTINTLNRREKLIKKTLISRKTTEKNDLFPSATKTENKLTFFNLNNIRPSGAMEISYFPPLTDANDIRHSLYSYAQFLEHMRETDCYFAWPLILFIY